MSEYLLAVVGIVLFASILLTILPDGKTTELIKNLTRIACLVTILTPICTFFVGDKEVEAIFGESGIQTDANFINYCKEEQIEETEKRLTTELSQLNPSVASICIVVRAKQVEYGHYTGELLRIEEIIIKVKNAQTASERAFLEEYILKNYGCIARVERIEVDDQ